MFNPKNWYWLADDGRLFSSSRMKTVNEKDKGYQEWLLANPDYGPTTWPCDDKGDQTDAALRVVLEGFGIIHEVPTITPRQLRLWLLGKGMLDKVEPLIDLLPEPDKSTAKIEWEYATSYTHDHEFMGIVGKALGFTPEDIEQGFQEAAGL